MRKTAQFTIYDSICHDLKEKILMEVYKPNDRLPSVLELCQIYNTSDSTIRKSLDMLKKDGYIYSVKRVGIFVSDSISKPYVFRFHELENLKSIADRYEILSIEVVEDKERKFGADKYLCIERMYYSNVLPLLYKIDSIVFNAKFDISKSNVSKWVEEMGFVLDSYFIKKYISIRLENGRNDIKNKMIIPYKNGMFKIEKKYYTEKGAFAAHSEIYVACSDMNLIFELD